MQKFTCLTCRVSLTTAENQRDHYKTEWHIYNLKRKLSLMAPLTEEEFQKVLQQHTHEDQPQASPDASFYCETCSKIFYNEKAFTQHNSSKKHFQLLANKPEKKITQKVREETLKDIEKPVVVEDKEEGQAMVVDGEAEEFNESDWEEVDSDDEILEGIPFDQCLFCSEPSQSMESNLAHMSQVHSFFIPDLEFCIDLKGLLNYLGIKIASGFCCLWCSEHGKQFASKKSAQQHMTDKGHTKIKLEHGSDTLLEFEDFYDYSPSYPEGGGDQPNEEVDIDELNLDGGDYQLKLPSGTVIGHRSLFVYYKQNLKPQPAEKKSKNKELLNKVMSQYKALGWTGMTNKDAVQRAKDIGLMHRVQRKYALKLGKRHNLSMQPHFRYQLGFQ